MVELEGEKTLTGPPGLRVRVIAVTGTLKVTSLRRWEVVK